MIPYRKQGEITLPGILWNTMIHSSARKMMDGPQVKRYLVALINTEPDLAYSIRYLFNWENGSERRGEEDCIDTLLSMYREQ